MNKQAFLRAYKEAGIFGRARKKLTAPRRISKLRSKIRSQQNASNRNTMDILDRRSKGDISVDAANEALDASSRSYAIRGTRDAKLRQMQANLPAERIKRLPTSQKAMLGGAGALTGLAGKTIYDIEQIKRGKKRQEEADERTREKYIGSPRGYTKGTGLEGILDMKENLRDTYGDAIDSEFAKADAYSKSQGLPFRMGEGYSRAIPLNALREPGAYYRMSPFGDEIALGDRGEYEGAIKDRLSAMFNGLEGVTLEQMRAHPEAPLRHEMAHAAHIRGDLDGRELKDLSSNVEYGQLPTYPEQVSPELIPPLAALQQHLFATTGRRLESPEEYDAFIDKVDRMSERDRSEYMQTLPPEVQRLFNYRKIMRMYNNNRLRQYDDVNRQYVPGVVQNAQNTGRGRI